MSIPTPSTPHGDNPRLNAILAEYMKRKDAGQPIDRQALLKAYPDLADGLRSYFEAESMMGGVGGAAVAETIQPKAPPQSPSLRETVLPGASASDTASEFRSRSFGRYQLLRPLGEGAMGSVFLAHDSALDRKVALKIPKVDGKGSGEFLARFSREAKAAAGLKHPNVCSVYDTGEHDGTPYITMGFIDGVPLSRFVGSSQLRTTDSILQMIATIADAVEHAHSKGVVHRDLKPGNILIDAKFKPHVTDFGLARRIRPDDEVRLTQEGLLIGTPAYMAPEQVKGEQAKVGPRSDVYSLGVILFELLTLRLPFEGSVPEMLAQVLRDHPPSPSKFRKDLPEDVDDLCVKMLRKDPEKRFCSMAEVASAIGKLREKLRQAPLNKDDAARQQSPFEIEKSHIEQMLTKGQYAAAIKALEKLSREKTPGAKAAAEWARKKLPDVRAEEKSLSPVGLTALLQTAQTLFEKHDYPGTIQLLEDVPALRRTEAMEDLLEKAHAREAEAEQLLDEIKDRERSQNMEGIEVLVKRFLKLKPGNSYAKRLWQALQSYNKTSSTRRQYRFEKGRLQPMPEPGFLKQWAVLGTLVGVLVFLSVYAYVIIYLKSDKQTLAVHVEDEWLKENGGELTLLVDGNEHTISTNSPNGDGLKVTVSLGDHTFSVKSGDAVVNNPESFTIQRDGRDILSITETNIELVAKVPVDPGKTETPKPEPPAPVSPPLLVKDQLKRIGEALHDYHDTYQMFPPANASPTTNLDDFTWRVLILPYLDQASTYNQINFQESWDSPKNKSILAALPAPFDSPTLSNDQRQKGLTVFLAPVAEGTVLGHKTGTNLPSITDGTSNTILLVAAHPNAAKMWSSPGELPIDMNDPLKDLKGQPGGEFAVLLCDGSVKMLPDSIDPEVFGRLLVRNDGKEVDWGKLQSTQRKGEGPELSMPQRVEDREYNGRDISGLIERDVGFNGIPFDPNQHGWRVEDGMLVGDGQASCLLFENLDVANFRAKIEFKASPSGNAGLVFHHTQFQGYLEIDLLDGETGNVVYVRPEHHQRVATADRRLPNDWSEMQVEVLDRQVTVWLDGTEIVSTKLSDELPQRGTVGLSRWDAASWLRIRKLTVHPIKSSTRPPTPVLPSPPDTVAILPAPILLSPKDGTFLGNRPQKNVMKWMPVAGATLYKVQIRFIVGPNGELGPACDFEAKTNQFENDLNGNRPKRWRVGTASGQSTAWSDWWEFRYRP